MKKGLHGEKKVWKESQTRSQLRIKSNLSYKGVYLLNDFLKWRYHDLLSRASPVLTFCID